MVLITIEGIDGTGKTTLVSHLRERLADLDPVVTKEPSAGWVGEQVRRAISERLDPIAEALLFAADHAAHLARVVKPALAGGKVVISDRYIDSRFAYQTVTLEGSLENPREWLRNLHDGWTVLPDRTFLLLLPVEVAMERLHHHHRREHFEEKGVLERVQRNYLELARDDPARFVLIDAERNEGEIAAFVEEEIRRVAGLSRSHRRS